MSTGASVTSRVGPPHAQFSGRGNGCLAGAGDVDEVADSHGLLCFRVTANGPGQLHRQGLVNRTDLEGLKRFAEPPHQTYDGQPAVIA
ncbi:MAG: hypothetical protein AAFR70_10935 [Pseudomonadota bacterium]